MAAIRNLYLAFSLTAISNDEFEPDTFLS